MTELENRARLHIYERFIAPVLIVVVMLPACAGTRSEPAAPTTSEQTSSRSGSAQPPPGINEPPPTAGRLLGTWSRIGTAGLIRFDKNGEFRIARNELDLTRAPFASGTYELEGRTLTLAGGCSSVWETGLADSELHVVVIEDSCGLGIGADVMFVRISRP